MELKELEILFSVGELSSATIVKYPLSNSWALQFSRKKESGIVMSSQRSDVRLFKTIDAAFNAARSVRFIKVMVDGS